jgi:hypothetical protein
MARPILRRLLWCGALTAGLAACSKHPDPPPPATNGSAATAPAPAPNGAGGPVQIEMRNVRLHAADGVILNVEHLRGQMVSTTPGRPPVFDDQRSYVLHLSAAELSMDMASLTVLMNDHVFAYEGAPLSDITVTVDEGRLAMKGTLRKGVPLPFSSKATIAPAPGGRLRLHTEKVKALGIPATKLLDLFNLTLEDLVSLEHRRGLGIKDDDIFLTPGQVLPPPEIRGNLSRAQLAGDRLLLTFGSAGQQAAPALTPPNPNARGYVYFSGASIRFGKLTMTGSDLQLIDADERDPFDFFPARYNRQLVAGYSKNTPSGGLETYMPDYDDLERGTNLKPKGF